MMALWLVPAFGVLALVYLSRHEHPSELLPQWDLLLTPKGHRTLGQVAEEVETDGEFLDHAYLRGLEWRFRNHAEAIRFLELAFRVVDRAVPRRLERIRGMRTCLRMAKALLPAKALSPSGFRLSCLISAAQVGGILHRVLITSLSRFRLRLRLLAFGFRVVLREMARSVRAAKDHGGTSVGWDEFAAASADFKSLDVEHLRAVRMLLEGMVAQRRIELAPAGRAN